MKPRIFIYACIILPALTVISSGRMHAQESIRGIVVDSVSLEALPSVSIKTKRTMTGTVTDGKGNFSIKALPGDTLVFSLVGYKTLVLPLEGYEAGIIRMSEQYTLLEAVTINEYRGGELYEGMFDEQNARLKKSIPFYLSKAKKEKIKLESLREENIRVQTYVDVVVNDPELKRRMMSTYALNEDEYYSVLTAFNETHYRVMYYLTRAELVSLLNTFFANHRP